MAWPAWDDSMSLYVSSRVKTTTARELYMEVGCRSGLPRRHLVDDIIRVDHIGDNLMGTTRCISWISAEAVSSINLGNFSPCLNNDSSISRSTMLACLLQLLYGEHHLVIRILLILLPTHIACFLLPACLHPQVFTVRHTCSILLSFAVGKQPSSIKLKQYRYNTF